MSLMVEMKRKTLTICKMLNQRGISAIERHRH